MTGAVAALGFLRNSDDSRSLDRGVRTPQLTEFIRSRGYRGGVIPMHRALIRFTLGPLDLVLSIGLVLGLFASWLLLLPRVCELWRSILVLGIRWLPLRAELGISSHHLTRHIVFAIPYPQVEALLPSADIWWLTAAVTGGLTVGSFFFSKRLLPVTYLLRGVLLVQITSLIYFAWIPARFPHAPSTFLESLASSGLVLIAFVPFLFGLTYYIFNFSLIKKLALAAITMGHLTLFLPLHMLLQALILQESVLFMPVLYIVFGLPVDILIVIAFYSWGMSWQFKHVGK